MSVQFPQLSLSEQITRYQESGKNTLFPYAFPFLFDSGTSTFDKTSALGIPYTSIAFQSDNHMAISAITFQAAIYTVSATTTKSPFFYFAISYSPIFNDGIQTFPVASPTPPTDIGNIIYQYQTPYEVTVSATNVNSPVLTIDDYHRFAPYNYLLKFNQIIYLHIASTFTNPGNPAGAILGSFILHTLATGLKT